MSPLVVTFHCPDLNRILIEKGVKFCAKRPWTMNIILFDVALAVGVCRMATTCSLFLPCHIHINLNQIRFAKCFMYKGIGITKQKFYLFQQQFYMD